MERIIAFSMERVIAFSIERVHSLTVSTRAISSQWNALSRSCLERAPTPQKFWRSFGVPAAFHFAFHLRSSNAFPVISLLLSGTVAP